MIFQKEKPSFASEKIRHLSSTQLISAKTVKQPTV